MENAFAWLGWITEWLARFVPKWEIVPTTHGWIKWVKGATVFTGTAGIVWYWPVTTKFETFPTARQAVDLRTQTLVTADNRTVVVGGMIVYEIKDLALIASTFDPDGTIRDLALGAIHDVCSGKTWDQLHAKGFDTEMKKEVSKRLESYGVRTLRTTLTDLAPARVIKLMQASSIEGT